MREIVNLAKLLRHFLGLWTVQHLKPRHIVTSQHSPLLGRSVSDPAASLFQAPRLSDPRNWGSAETKKTGGNFFPAPPSFSRLRHSYAPSPLSEGLELATQLRRETQQRWPGKRQEAVGFAGYSTCCWNIFGKRVMFSITVGITSPLDWLFGNPLIAWNLGNCSSVPVWAVLCVGFCLRACLHGGGGPQVVEVTHLGEVTFLSI